MIEVRGSEEMPLIVPFVTIDGVEVPFTNISWKREHYWIPAMSANVGELDFSMTILTPIEERGWAMKLTVTGKEDTSITWVTKLLQQI